MRYIIYIPATTAIIITTAIHTAACTVPPSLALFVGPALELELVNSADPLLAPEDEEENEKKDEEENGEADEEEVEIVLPR